MWQCRDGRQQSSRLHLGAYPAAGHSALPSPPASLMVVIMTHAQVLWLECALQRLVLYCLWRCPLPLQCGPGGLCPLLGRWRPPWQVSHLSPCRHLVTLSPPPPQLGKHGHICRGRHLAAVEARQPGGVRRCQPAVHLWRVCTVDLPLQHVLAAYTAPSRLLHCPHEVQHGACACGWQPRRSTGNASLLGALAPDSRTPCFTTTTTAQALESTAFTAPEFLLLLPCTLLLLYALLAIRTRPWRGGDKAAPEPSAAGTSAVKRGGRARSKGTGVHESAPLVQSLGGRAARSSGDSSNRSPLIAGARGEWLHNSFPSAARSPQPLPGVTLAGVVDIGSDALQAARTPLMPAPHSAHEARGAAAVYAAVTRHDTHQRLGRSYGS